MKVIASDPYLDPGDPAWGETERGTADDVFARADVLSLHVPLTDGTRHLVNADRLAAMKQGAIVINAARGGVVDEAALAGALTSGHIAGAALDVFETEPLTAEAGARFAVLNVLPDPAHCGCHGRKQYPRQCPDCRKGRGPPALALGPLPRQPAVDVVDAQELHDQPQEGVLLIVPRVVCQHNAPQRLDDARCAPRTALHP